MKLKIRTILNIIVLIILTYITIVMVKGIYISNKIDLDNLPPLKHAVSGDTGIFDKKYRSKLKTDVIYQRKDRTAISALTFDSAYNLIVYKIDSSQIISLTKQFYFSQEKMSLTNGETYPVIPIHRFQLLYIYEPPKIRREIYFTVSGNSLREGIRNDSVFYCNMFCDNFSIRFGKNDPIDLLLRDKDDDIISPTKLRIRASMTFLKKKHDLYFVMMTPIKEERTMNDDLLWQLIKKSD